MDWNLEQFKSRFRVCRCLRRSRLVSVTRDELVGQVKSLNVGPL